MILRVFRDAGHASDVDDTGFEGLGVLKEGEECYCYKVDCSDVCFKDAVPAIEVFVVPKCVFQLGGYC